MCVHTCLLGGATVKASRLSELWSMSLPDDSPEGRTFQPKSSTCKTPPWIATRGLICLQPRVASGMTAEAGYIEVFHVSKRPSMSLVQDRGQRLPAFLWKITTGTFYNPGGRYG